jgi:CheY-like chemotaxis protein
VRTGKITLRVERSSVREVVQLAIETCATIIEEHAQTLTVALPEEELVLVGDRTRLVQVFANLLSNAAKYSTPGGHIRVTARRDAGEILVQVSDSGVGISADLLPTVWDLFTQVRNTVDKAQGGLGIGLSLVKKLVDLHGGSVTAESAGVGQGSTFSVRLPVAPVVEDNALPVPRVEGDAAVTVSPAGRRVLVVDDNVDAADSQTILLGIAGYTTATAYSGRDAVQCARAFRPDVILLDIGLPDVDGYEVARQLRADPLTADMVLVALTGWGSDDHKRMSKEAGFDWHLTKPVEAKALTAALSLRHVARL